MIDRDKKIMDAARKIAEAAESPADSPAQITRNIGRLELIMAAVIIVLFVGFFGMAVAVGGIYVDVSRSENSSYSDLVNTINQQNLQISALTKALHK